MTSNPLTEKEFQRVVIDHLVNDDEYIERNALHDYDPVYAMDKEMLFKFLEDSQHDTMEKLRSIYNGGHEATVLNVIDSAIRRQGLIQCLWDGVDFDGGVKLDLVEPRPSALFDKKASDLFETNTLSVMEEVWHKEDERIDLVIFINGISLFTIELKCNTTDSGWDYREAIRQYCEDRDNTTRLLMPRIGAVAHFAMDLNEVYVCAELHGKNSTFLPFNMGAKEEGFTHATAEGNPLNPNGLRVAYMWENIFTKDTIFDLIYDFIYISKKADSRGKVKERRQVFPRYQQLRAVTRVAADITNNGTTRDYLIEHSTGSGKTNTIGWLAHKLSSLYQPGSDDPIFDKVIIITDRKVVDQQLQEAVLDMSKDSGIVRVLDKGKTSADLSKALHKSYRIVVSTIQKFLNIKQGTFEDADKRFAVLIDEAHGSTSGKSMSAVDSVLSGGVDEDMSGLDEVSKFLKIDIARSGKQPNVSMIGFTATPTGRTLQQFGNLNEKGEREAFDLYSMNQAIKEGFILDVTANYTTYNTYCRVVKAIADDPELESKAAKRKLAHLINVDEKTIDGKLSVMIEHFTGTVAPTLGERAKGMIVTSSREAAVKFFLAYEELRKQNMRVLGKYRALVAFTDSIEIDGKTYTEAGLNGFSEEETADAFNGDDYRLLIVADKYQTGFDQPYLAAMYVDKKLSGVAAVQTLSRLNRICPPYDKRTFVLDFVNSFESIQESFAPFYKSTVLTDPLTLTDVRETERRLRSYNILDDDDIDEFNVLLAKPSRTNTQKERMWALIDVAVDAVGHEDENTADEIRRVIRNFIRQYSFLLQVAPFVDERMHKEYNFCVSLIRSIDAGHGTPNFDISDKVSLEEFDVEKGEEHVREELTASPEVQIAKGTGTGLSNDQFERLSRIIEQWNARYGTHFNASIAAGSVMSLNTMLMDDPKVQQSARVNSKADFRNTVNDQSEDALVRGYDQNEEWYGFLLNNEDARKQLVGVLVDGMYHALHNTSSKE